MDFARIQSLQSEQLAAGFQELEQKIKQRHLSDEQRLKLVSLLKTAAPQELYFVSAPDAETTYFANEVLAILDKAGWKVVEHPSNWGILDAAHLHREGIRPALGRR